MKILAWLLPALLSLPFSSHAKNSDPDPVIMTVGDDRVRMSEFEYLYRKNNSQQTVQVALDKYIDMFVDYKLKVCAARSAGLDTMRTYLDDMRSYTLQLAEPYMTDREMTDSLVAEAYAHLRSVATVRILAIDGGRNPQDATRVADSLREVACRGVDFEEIASGCNALPVNVRFDGQLRVTGGSMPYIFEDAISRTGVGEISVPVKSQLGVHLFKVVDRREATTEIKVRHILKATHGLDETAKAAQRHAIDSLHAILRSGRADFAETASRETEDPSGRSTGGNLSWFGRGRMVEPFEEAAFSLADGQMSEVVETPFGYHLILRESSREMLPLDSVRSMIEESVNSDMRRHWTLERALLRFAAANGMSTATESDIATVRETMLRTLPDREPAFGHLLKEYSDGMLLFEISNRRVWDRANTDTEGLQKYFEAHRDSYAWTTPHYKGFLVSAVSDSIADMAVAHLASAGCGENAFQQELRKRFGNNVKIDRVIAARGDNAIIDHIAFGGRKPENTSRWKAFRRFAGEVADQPENASDVKGRVSIDYQQELEDRWLEELRATYKVKVDRKAIARLLK